MNSKYNGVFISDIHLGAAHHIYDELTSIFIEYIKNNKLDFIIFGGDYFDNKVSLGSKLAKNGFTFLKTVLDITKKNNTKVRMIKGTHSHDNNQLDTFMIFEKEYDFRVINYVSSELLFSDMHVLYIPEEYITSINDTYGEFFNKTYDMIFGHGMFKEVAFQKSESETISKRAPVFDSKKLISISNGPILFGHIHVHQQIKHKIFYAGSFSRYQYGESGDKGFLTIVKNHNDYSIKLFKNDMCPKYDTVDLKLDDDAQIESIISLIQDLFHMYKGTKNHLRIRIDISNISSSIDTIHSTLREIFGNIHNLKIIVTNSIQETADAGERKRQAELRSIYDFLFNHNIPLEERIYSFISLQHGIEVPIDIISTYITKE